MWAFNPARMGSIEEFIRVEFRDSRGNEPQAGQLPGRIKSGDYWEEVLKCIRKLRDSS